MFVLQHSCCGGIPFSLKMKWTIHTSIFFGTYYGVFWNQIQKRKEDRTRNVYHDLKRRKRPASLWKWNWSFIGKKEFLFILMESPVPRKTSQKPVRLQMEEETCGTIRKMRMVWSPGSILILSGSSNQKRNKRERSPSKSASYSPTHTNHLWGLPKSVNKKETSVNKLWKVEFRNEISG